MNQLKNYQKAKKYEKQRYDHWIRRAKMRGVKLHKRHLKRLWDECSSWACRKYLKGLNDYFQYLYSDAIKEFVPKPNPILEKIPKIPQGDPIIIPFFKKES
tara:strand:- start:1153 stop:1455 length:303 start_codon:yes stop_codon:yes gene_type:complete